MSVMLYACILCVALFMDLFVLCVACLIVFANCLVKQVAMCLGVVDILLLNVMEVFSEGGVLCWIGHAWSSNKCAVCACDPSFVYVFVCHKLSPHLRVYELDHMCLLSLCSFCVYDLAYYAVG